MKKTINIIVLCISTFALVASAMLQVKTSAMQRQMIQNLGYGNTKTFSETDEEMQKHWKEHWGPRILEFKLPEDCNEITEVIKHPQHPDYVLLKYITKDGEPASKKCQVIEKSI